MTGDAASRTRAFLEGEDREGRITLIGKGARAWDVLVPSYWKETISLSLELGDRTLRAEAFFMRSPEENSGQAYKLLLERNLASKLWRFASNEAGDISLVAEIPGDAVTDEELDQMLGGLVRLTDETYRPFFELAFETALREQVERGGPGLDAAPPWAATWDQPASPPS